MYCTECKSEQPQHECYNSSGELQTVTLIADNSSRTSKREMCYSCWKALQDRAFCTVSRTGNTFYAITAF